MTIILFGQWNAALFVIPMPNIQLYIQIDSFEDRKNSTIKGEATKNIIDHQNKSKLNGMWSESFLIRLMWTVIITRVVEMVLRSVWLSSIQASYLWCRALRFPYISSFLSLTHNTQGMMTVRVIITQIFGSSNSLPFLRHFFFIFRFMLLILLFFRSESIRSVQQKHQVKNSIGNSNGSKNISRKKRKLKQMKQANVRIKISNKLNYFISFFYSAKILINPLILGDSIIYYSIFICVGELCSWNRTFYLV